MNNLLEKGEDAKRNIPNLSVMIKQITYFKRVFNRSKIRMH